MSSSRQTATGELPVKYNCVCVCVGVEAKFEQRFTELLNESQKNMIKIGSIHFVPLNKRYTRLQVRINMYNGFIFWKKYSDAKQNV